MKNIIFLFLFQIITFTSYAQRIYNPHYQRNAISISPSSYFSLYHSSINFSYERRFYKQNKRKPHWAVELSYGQIRERHFNNANGFIIQAMPKFRKGDNEATYMGWNNYYTSHQYISNKAGAPTDYEVNAKIFGSEFILGSQNSYKHWFADISVGFGFKFYNIKNTLEEPVNSYSSSRILFLGIPEEDGRHFRLNVPIKFKFGFSF